jgi:CBS domain-containing protein
MDGRTKVAEVMSELVVTVGPEARLQEAARLLREDHASGLPMVAPPHRVVGVLSERDIVRSLHQATGFDSARGLLDLLLDSASPRVTASLRSADATSTVPVSPMR